MLFQRFESEGLAHYSYLIGDGEEAALIDPRRDVEAYLEAASRAGLPINHVLETHRHEDFVVGSLELASRNRTELLHPQYEDVDYGEPIRDGEVLRIGSLRLEALHTPGHTPGHMSYLLRNGQGAPWVIFSGDALFAGDVGRVDLLGRERLVEMAGLLYDSLFQRLLPLGDEVIVCPAHGAGSACGESISDRPWTTIGLERQYNPRLRYEDRATFVAQVGHELEFPPYFREMERMNKQGPPLLGPLPSPRPVPAREFSERAREDQVLDTRQAADYGAAHVPGSLSIWEEGIPRFAGWFLSYDRPLLLVGEGNDPSTEVRYLARVGLDRFDGFLAGGMLEWHKHGLASRRVQTLTVQELCRRLDRGEEAWILDVRSAGELKREGRLPGAHHIHVTQLPEHIGEVPADRPVYVFCGSGLRSMIAASLLERAGRQNLNVVLGGVAGWSSRRYPLWQEAEPGVGYEQLYPELISERREFL